MTGLEYPHLDELLKPNIPDHAILAQLRYRKFPVAYYPTRYIGPNAFSRYINKYIIAFLRRMNNPNVNFFHESCIC